MKNSIRLNLLKKIGFKRLGSSFISNFGFLWLLTEPGALFFPEKLNFGWIGYLWLAILASGWQSLSKLWQEIRLKGHGIDISIPIVGADLARIGLPRMALAKLIITSFIVASKEQFITRKLTVMIYPKDVESINFYELEEFLASACF